MEGAILSGQLAAKAAAEAILEREKDTFEEAPKPKNGPFNKNAQFSNEIKPDKELYRVRVVDVPKEVERELARNLTQLH